MTTVLESLISEIQNLWGSSFFSKYLKIKLDFKNAAKNRENAFLLWDNCIWIRIFPTQLTRQSSMNMIKVLWRRFQKCLESFLMLLFEGSSELGVFRHLNDYLFGFPHFGNTKSMRVIFFCKIIKISARFQKWILKKKDDPHRLSIFEITHSESVVR